MENPVEVGLMTTDRMNRTALRVIIYLMSWSPLRNPLAEKIFLQRDPGWRSPQYGHGDSSMLISFLQLGHRIERLS